MKKFPRLVVATATAVGLSVTAVAVADAADGGSTKHHLRTPKVPDQPSYSLDGLDTTVARAAQFAYALDENRRRDAAQAAAAAAAAAASRQRNTSTAAPTRVYARSGGSVNWDGIAMCETGGNWSHQTRFDGGLGIYHGAWVDFGGQQFAPYGSQATKAQQIVVAERIYARFGLSGWGCKAYG